ncbi:MAG: hypothetical protein ACLT98_16650 [Eggerthellaceae bacterium]
MQESNHGKGTFGHRQESHRRNRQESHRRTAKKATVETAEAPIGQASAASGNARGRCAPPSTRSRGEPVEGDAPVKAVPAEPRAVVAHVQRACSPGLTRRCRCRAPGTSFHLRSNLQSSSWCVGSLTDLSPVKKHIIDEVSMITTEQLEAIYARCHELYPIQERTYESVRKLLCEHGVRAVP